MISALLVVALVVGLIGWLWIVVMAFSEGEMLWGIGSLIISPIAIVYGIMNFQELKIPLGMMVGGAVVRIAGSAVLIAGQ